MTVSSSASRISYAGNGSETIFAFPYYFLDESDLVVVRRDDATGAETTLALGGDYGVSGAGEAAGGAVTMTAAPAAGQTLTIRRVVALTQETDFVANDPLSAEVLERALDRATMAAQQLQEQADRALKVPVGDSASLSTTLPAAAVRASRTFGFNAAGEPIAVDPPVVSSTDLVVVASTAPAHQQGRLWIDTGTAGLLIVKQSDGAGWTELWRVDTAADAFLHQSDVTLASADAGAAQGPTLTLDRASASPAAADLLGALAFQGRSAAGAARGYARLLADVLDATDGSEDGRLLFQTAVAGTLGTRLTLRDRLLLAVALETAKGAAVASAATTDIWGAGDGTLLHVTGTTTITSLGTAPQAGALRVLLFDAAATLTHGANLILNAGGANITTAAGDMAIAIADTTTKIYCYVIRGSGGAVATLVGSSVTLNPYAGTAAVSGAHGLGTYPTHIETYIECLTAELGYSVGDRVYLSGSGLSDTTNARAISVVADGTNLTILTGTGAFDILNKGTGISSTITNARWKVVATPSIAK